MTTGLKVLLAGLAAAVVISYVALQAVAAPSQAHAIVEEDLNGF